MPTLKEYRFEAGLSISELARRADVDAGTVRRAESGQPVQELNAFKIARAVAQALNKEITVKDFENLNVVV